MRWWPVADQRTEDALRGVVAAFLGILQIDSGVQYCNVKYSGENQVDGQVRSGQVTQPTRERSLFLACGVGGLGVRSFCVLWPA